MSPSPLDSPEHRPVMLSETIDCLRPRAGEVHVDATVGPGGHAAPILALLGASGLLVGIDRDRDALELAERRLSEVGFPFRLVRGPYSQLRAHLASTQGTLEGRVDGLLLDLGVSSLQLDRPERGFSFLRDGPLDMRMAVGEGESVAAYLGRASVEELERILREFGEERFARRIAREIDRARHVGGLETTGQLAALVERVLPRARGRIHPATRTFQALRIAVNQELAELREVLRDADRVLCPGGRLVVLAYHSLEDRIVKEWGQSVVRSGFFRWLEKKPLRPQSEEVGANPRARSARLRALVRSET